jgi:hypothetical protein
MNKKLNKRNSRILHQALASLGALKGASSALQEMHINEIQVHLLDERGDGVILCLEYEEPSGEITKTFSCVDEFYDDTVEVELDACNSPENREQSESSFIEEVISEEYDEIFHSATNKKPPPLLN